MENDLKRQRRWVKQPPTDPNTAPSTTTTTTTTHTALHPQQQVAQEANAWTTVWDTPHPADQHGTLHDEWQHTYTSQLAALQHTLPTSAPNPQQPPPQLTAQQLHRAATRTKGKAGGGDHWTADALLQLPPTWWQALAELWNTILHTARIPAAWNQTVVVLLNKPSGGTRPISITSILWRLGASALVKHLAPWTHQWAPPELCGGLPQRDATYLHARIFHDLQDSDHEDFVFLSQDLSKAFDSIHIPQALALFTHYGAPQQITQLLLTFYRTNKRIFLFHGAMHPEWRTSKHGLLQGCPFSPMLLATTMALWQQHMRQQHPQHHAGIFLDDRSAWITGPDACTTMATFLETSQSIDAQLGFKENRAKTQLAVATPELQPILDSLTPEGYPQATTTFNLLGLTYDLQQRHIGLAESTVAKYTRRAHRIRHASRQLPRRQQLHCSMALSCITWAGPFAHLPALQLRSIHNTAMHTIKHWTPRGASRHNIWTAELRPDDDPRFAIQHLALQFTAKIAKLSNTTNPWLQHIRQWLHTPQHLQHIPAIRQALQTNNINWNATTNTLHRRDHLGRNRTIRLAWDGHNTIRDWQHDHWLTTMYKQEERLWKPRRRQHDSYAIGLRLPAPDPTHLPVMTAHRIGRSMPYTTTSTPQRQTYIATGTSAWHQAARHNTSRPPCLCGKPEPSMAHLLWVCTAIPQHQPGVPPAPRAPRNTCEERLITSTAPKPITPLHPTGLTPTPPARLLQIIDTAFTTARSQHQPLTVATDGGAKHGCAAWAIATPSDSIAEAIQGEDTTPFMAELTAILLLTHSIHNLPDLGGSDTQHTIIVATDCKSAIDYLQGPEPTVPSAAAQPTATTDPPDPAVDTGTRPTSNLGTDPWGCSNTSRTQPSGGHRGQHGPPLRLAATTTLAHHAAASTQLGRARPAVGSTCRTALGQPCLRYRPSGRINTTHWT